MNERITAPVIWELRKLWLLFDLIGFGESLDSQKIKIVSPDEKTCL